MRNLLFVSAFAMSLMLVASVVTLPASAQDNQVPTDTQPAAPAETEQPAAPAEGEQAAPDAVSSEKLLDAQDQSEVRGSWIIGTVVKSSITEDDVGAIEDFLIDTESDAITGVVISVGGFLGIGSKSIAVEWSRLQIDYDGYQITSDLTREEAEAAPEYVFRERETPPPPPDPALNIAPEGGTTAPM